MAAEKLEMSELEAIQYFAEAFERDIPSEAIHSFCHARSTLKFYREFWDSARLQMLNPTTEQRKYLQHLGWNPRSAMSQDRTMNGPGKLFTVVDPRQIKSQFKRSHVRVTQSMVMVPYYNRPDQIAGFTCMGSLQEFTINNPQAYTNKVSIEPGFAGFQLLDQMHSDTVITTSMLRNWGQLHMRHFSSNQNPLPILGWKPPALTTRQRQWSNLGGRKIVIWEREPTAISLNQALMCDANMAFVGPATKRDGLAIKGSRWKTWISHDPAIDIWRRIVRNSRPVEHALKNWARNATPNQKIKLLQDAEQYDDQTATLVRSAVNEKVSVQVGRVIRIGTNPRYGLNSGGQTTIIERDGKWFSQTGKVRFPGIVRVTHIVARPSGEKEYVGYVRAEGKEVPFQLPVSKASMSWIKNHCIENGLFLQTESYTNDFHNHKAENFDPFAAATKFELPEVVTGLERVGWDGIGFQFRSSRLVDGTFHQNPEFKLPADSPGPRQHFCRMRPEVRTALLRDGTEMEIVWALAIAVCAQVTAPVVGLHPFGIWIHRQKYDPFLQALFNRFGLFKGPYTGWKHKWPRRLDRWQHAVNQDDSGYFVTWFAAEPSISELLVVRAQDENLQPRGVTHSADKIILNYLKHFSTLETEFPGNWKNWVNFTTEQFQKVFDFADTESFKAGLSRVKVV